MVFSKKNPEKNASFLRQKCVYTSVYIVLFMQGEHARGSGGILIFYYCTVIGSTYTNVLEEIEHSEVVEKRLTNLNGKSIKKVKKKSE